jgi:DNA invertase Pin-like site-specific DNA recombinase
VTHYDGPYKVELLTTRGQAYKAASDARGAAMKALAVEVRKAAEAGVPKEQIARLAGISKPTVYRILDGKSAT